MNDQLQGCILAFSHMVEWAEVYCTMRSIHEDSSSLGFFPNQFATTGVNATVGGKRMGEAALWKM